MRETYPAELERCHDPRNAAPAPPPNTLRATDTIVTSSPPYLQTITSVCGGLSWDTHSTPVLWGKTPLAVAAQWAWSLHPVDQPPPSHQVKHLPSCLSNTQGLLWRSERFNRRRHLHSVINQGATAYCRIRCCPASRGVLSDGRQIGLLNGCWGGRLLGQRNPHRARCVL